MTDKPTYAGKVAIRHAVEAARACGIEVEAIELRPDGTIYVGQARAQPVAETAYDRWMREQAAAGRPAKK